MIKKAITVLFLLLSACSTSTYSLRAPSTTNVQCGGIDDSLALSNAVNQGGFISISGRCVDNQTLKISVSGTAITGTSPYNTQLVSNSSTAPQINVTAPDFEISGVKLNRTVTPTIGADGIDACLNTVCSQPVIRRVQVYGSYYGMKLGPVGYGTIHNVILSNNASDGLLLSGMPFSNMLQWQLWDVLSQMNGGNGFRAIADPLGGSGTLGPWRDGYTFNNKQDGLLIQGQAAGTLSDAQITSGFYGSDCDNEIEIAGNGINYIVANNITELAGFGMGCPSPTPPSNGNGLLISPGTSDVHVSNNHFSTSWANGIATAGSRVDISGGGEVANGKGNNPTYGNGIAVMGGPTSISGGISYANLGWGLIDWSPVEVTATGLICSSNTAGKHGGPAQITGGDC